MWAHSVCPELVCLIAQLYTTRCRDLLRVCVETCPRGQCIYTTSISAGYIMCCQCGQCRDVEKADISLCLLFCCTWCDCCQPGLCWWCLSKSRQPCADRPLITSPPSCELWSREALTPETVRASKARKPFPRIPCEWPSAKLCLGCPEDTAVRALLP